MPVQQQRKPWRARRSARVPLQRPEDAARAAQLRYVSDSSPGITRKGPPSRFTYEWRDGQRVRDRATLQRIRALAIPPAWTDVWICRIPNGHMQATGRDARNRKQYRYHERWRLVRDGNKYARLSAFGQALGPLRERVSADMSLPGFSRDKVVAMVVRLLEITFVRVGNETYARSNGSFGLTTLRKRHVKPARSGLRLRFPGKSGVMHDVAVTDRRLTRLVRRCRELQGQELFQYLDADGEPQPVDSTDVNEYLQAATGSDFTAKDFRTWAGTLLGLRYLVQHAEALAEAPPKAFTVDLVREVAGALGNTPAVCRKCYIHPAVLQLPGDDGARERLLALIRVSTPEEEAGWEHLLQQLMRSYVD
ncbi:MAG: DNA topoisomerase IB [Gemmatimonadaceae bacterium]